MTKILIEIQMEEMLGEKMIAEQIKKTLETTFVKSFSHPSIKEITIKIEP